MPRFLPRRHGAALAALLGCLALALLLYHDLAGGTLLQHSPYDSYALQAENWLAGRIWIEDGEAYPWLELAVYQGRYYQSFPPVPAAALLPFVALGGGAQAVPSNLICGVYGLLAAAGVYGCFWRRGAPPAAAAFGFEQLAPAQCGLALALALAVLPAVELGKGLLRLVSR